MEAGGKDSEEETLQTAFKKLRVDAESLPVAVNVSEALAPRAVPRACPDTSGAKPKLGCPKDNWHGCMRKTSRGASRTQRRRRSKSPILHPPKFTYCSNTAASTLSPPSSCLKHQRLAVPESLESCPGGEGRAPSTVAVAAHKELSSSGASAHISLPVFGASAGYEPSIGAGVVVSSTQSQEIPTVITTTATTPRQGGGSSTAAQSGRESGLEKVCGGAESESGAVEASDFRALSRLHSSGSSAGPCPPCSCARNEGSNPGECQGEGAQGAGSQCQCQSRCQTLHPGWHGVEVYSFTGLRNVISECERSLPNHEDARQAERTPHSPRTLSNTATATSPASSPPSLSSGSPRSCSEQARAYVDDITIEDLSGYMEYYLYIPKKMSHMAEMMYT
ncbi:oxidative stress-responsive serine-rich protein 1 [Myripristis murdjan]|uniref:Oxidative stress-responsive serine-rich protein 1 n=1 Tax=Myripristis murdjan TaxID=586833 RepID=A0A667WYU8_9TELE|nr:oxidative stress-responsive serine-rich protein 1 [Myripristis murdjan]